jgi:hypothetical protein
MDAIIQLRTGFQSTVIKAYMQAEQRLDLFENEVLRISETKRDK